MCYFIYKLYFFTEAIRPFQFALSF